MENLSHIWNTIVMSNTFNFTIFVLLLAFIFKKIDVASIISNLQEKIKQLIENAKKAREEALGKLKEAEKAVENVEEEVSTILKDADKTAKILSNKIIEDAKKQIESIELNAKKIVEAEEKVLHASLVKKTAQASLEVATNHIKDTLNQNANLHDKYINESIDELDRLSL